MKNTTVSNQENEISSPSKTQELVNARNETLASLKEEGKSESFVWLNEYSRKFLASGYLTEGATPESRILEIAQRAEQILQIPGYAEKFYN